MDPIIAALSFAGNALGGLFGFLSADRQASVVETGIEAQRDIRLRAFDSWLESMFSRERLLESGQHYGRDIAWTNADVQRDRIFYNYQAVEALRGSFVAAAGVGLLALATYLALRDEK